MPVTCDASTAEASGVWVSYNVRPVTCNASAAEASRVWVSYNVRLTVWRIEWPKDVVELYKAEKLSNLDWEMAVLLI